MQALKSGSIVLKGIALGLLATSMTMAAITGKVTDVSGAAIAGAAVRLEAAGQTATSGSDGSFTLGPATGINAPANKAPQRAFAITTRSGLLQVNVSRRAVIEITAFALDGRELLGEKFLMDRGVHSITLPHHGLGVCLYPARELEPELAGAAVDGRSSSSESAKLAKVTAAITDIMSVSKVGYLNYRVMVGNSDTAGIMIPMIACADSVRDADGNLYHAAKIGNQIWTVENLRATKYGDGSGLPNVTDGNTWGTLTTPAYCFYNNATNTDTMAKYGALYNWYVVAPTNPKQIAPAGWHVPSNAEWDTLQNYLIAHGYNWNGVLTGNDFAKSLATRTDWVPYWLAGSVGNNPAANNKSGFNAPPTGYRFPGSFNVQGYNAYWWTTTETASTTAMFFGIDYGDTGPQRQSYNKSGGYSIRLVKNSPTGQSGKSLIVQEAVKDPNPSNFDSYDNGSGVQYQNVSQSVTFTSNTTNGNTLLAIAVIASDGLNSVFSAADPVNGAWTQVGDITNYSDCNSNIKAFVKFNAQPLLTTSWSGTGAVSSGGVLTIGSGSGVFRLRQHIKSPNTPAATSSGGDVIVVTLLSGTLGASGSTYQLNNAIGSKTFASEAMTTNDFVSITRNASCIADYPGAYIAEISGTDGSSVYFSGNNDAPTSAGTNTVASGPLAMPSSPGMVVGFGFNGGINNSNPFPPLYAPNAGTGFTHSTPILQYNEGNPICTIESQNFSSVGTRAATFSPTADSRYSTVAVGFLDAP